MTFPARLSLAVTIGGVNVTDYIIPGTFRISNVLTHQVDTCKFALEDAAAISPADWQEVIVTDGATRIFGGYTLTLDDEEGPNQGVDYTVSASDYSVRLGRVIAKKEYLNQTDAAILADLFSTYLPGEGYNAATYVEAVKTHGRIRFNRMTLLECIKALADYADADWYIDYNKNLHFFSASTSAAPFGLSDAPDFLNTYPYNSIKINRDGSGVVNRVEVVGGNYLSNDATFYLPGTGQDTRASLPFRLVAPSGQAAVQVWRNDGTEGTPTWTPLTVKVGYIDQLAGANEVLYYYQEKVLEAQAAWPARNNAIKVTGRYEVPLRTRATDPASYALYGLWFDDVIVDNDITDKATARLAALGKLAQSALAKSAISLNVDQPGLRAGQTVQLTNSRFGLNGEYLIQGVAATIGVNGRAGYAVKLGTYNPDLIDLMVALARGMKKRPVWREDEVLDELLQVVESLPLVEANSITATSGPYYFSDNPAEAFYWGFGAFE